MYIRELYTAKSRIWQSEERQWGQAQKRGLICFGPLFALSVNNYSLLKMSGNVLILVRCLEVFDPNLVVMMA